MLADLLFEVVGLSPASPLVRLILAALTGFLCALAFGRPFIAWLRSKGINDGKSVKASDTLQVLHAQSGKARTPTMGGPIILAGLVAGTLVWGPIGNPIVWAAMGLVLLLALVGYYDDSRKLVKIKGRDGMRSRTKLALQLVIAIGAAGTLTLAHEHVAARSMLVLPFVEGAAIDLGWFAVPFAVLVIVGSCNAVNFTDGLDGLAGGVSAGVSILMAGFALLVGGLITINLASDGTPIADATASLALLNIPGPDAMAAATLACSLLGGLLGFLWFNAPPADVFMGDTGSLPLGGLLGFLACVVKLEIVFAIVAFVFVAEVMSVVLQVASFKLTGKRIFKCAPIHHHFQFLGWAETKIVVRFWIVTAVCAGFGLLMLVG